MGNHFLIKAVVHKQQLLWNSWWAYLASKNQIHLLWCFLAIKEIKQAMLSWTSLACKKNIIIYIFWVFEACKKSKSSLLFFCSSENKYIFFKNFHLAKKKYIHFLSVFLAYKNKIHVFLNIFLACETLRFYNFFSLLQIQFIFCFAFLRS